MFGMQARLYGGHQRAQAKAVPSAAHPAPERFVEFQYNRRRSPTPPASLSRPVVTTASSASTTPVRTTDTGGLLVTALVHGANIQDRDGAPAVLASIRYAFPWLRHVFADGAYGGPKLEAALRRLGRWTLEIVKRSDAAQGFEVIPRRWVVERTLAWLNRNRRLAKDFEATIASAETWLFLASVQLLTRRLARA